MTIHQTTLDNTFDEWRANTNATDSAVGDITLLTTADTSSIVAAVNEVKATAADDSFLNALLFGG
jgi:hypothetical protein